ncbi:hypothetical protein [Deinococcus sp. UYEF24]
MSTETLLALLAAAVALLSAVYAGRQARSAQDQVTQAKNQVQEAVRANAIAAEGLALLKQEQEAASKVDFKFRPGRSPSAYQLDLVNVGPHDTYVVNAQLSGPGVNPRITGRRLNSLSKLGGGDPFVEAREAVKVMDAQGAPNFAGYAPMAYDTTAQLLLTLKTNGVIYEVRTDVTLSAERGFSTLHTMVTRQ